MEAYRPLRPQAASCQEELERFEARRAAEDGILKLTAEWQERMARARQVQEAATAAHRAEPAVEEEKPPARKQADGEPAAIDALTTERDRLQALKAAAPRRRYWPDLAVARMLQTLRSGLIDGASDP